MYLTIQGDFMFLIPDLGERICFRFQKNCDRARSLYLIGKKINDRVVRN